MKNEESIIKLIKIANKLDELGLYESANKLTKVAIDIEDSYGKDYADRSKVFFDPQASESELGRDYRDKQRRELDLFLRSTKFDDENLEKYNIRLEDDIRSLIYEPDTDRIKDYRATLEELMEKVSKMEQELDKDFEF